MTEDEIRRLREALNVLQEQLIRNLMYDALQTNDVERLNFFRAYRGGMMDGVVIDWWKIFGNCKEQSHWTNLLPKETHQDVRDEITRALTQLEPKEDFETIWKRVSDYRITAAAHLDFDKDARAATYPWLAPLRVSAEIMYRRIFGILDEQNRARGFPPPAGMTGTPRDRILDHHREIVGVVRNALADYENVPS